MLPLSLFCNVDEFEADNIYDDDSDDDSNYEHCDDDDDIDFASKLPLAIPY